MNEQQLTSWLEGLKQAWEDKKPEAALDLVADSFKYYEEPFKKPLTTRQELLDEWKSILDHENVSLSYEVVCVDESVGIAKWHAKFIRISTQESVEMEGVYQVSLDNEGKCTEFHQWYNSK